ncbi:hypothetical protein WBG78_01650 [Chryseolinea sp. T2]|uniref:hypothetical protein n=1 Tax=Chryseolinea sp. T2 TaxID=3129255 RepID=UPI0030769ACC
MMRLLIVALCIVSTYAGAQNPLRMLVTANANYYLPRNSGKQIYPILAYDGDADPKLLVGGFGLGFMIEQDVRNHIFWRAQINTSRRAYWDEVMLFNDVTGLPIGGAVCKGVDVVTNVTGAIHYKIGKSLSIGTGVGFDGLVYSYSRLPEKFIDNEVVRNSYYRPFVPLIPLELSVPIKRVLINLRYQHALINRLKSSIAEYEKDTYSALFIEVGYRIR